MHGGIVPFLGVFTGDQLTQIILGVIGVVNTFILYRAAVSGRRTEKITEATHEVAKESAQHLLDATGATGATEPTDHADTTS